MTRFLFTAALLILLSAPGAAASPRGDVMQAIERLAGASSYAVRIESPQAGAAGPIQLEYVAPDRYRMMIPGAPAQTIIGNRVFMDIGGRTMQAPLPAGTLEQMRGRAHIRETHQNARIEAAGTEPLDGRPASRYRILHPDQPGVEVTLWVGDDGWPLRMHVDGPDGAATMHYSRFNDPALVIQPPG